MFQNAKISKFKKKKKLGISKSRVGILLYSKTERKTFLDFQNQGRSDVNNQTMQCSGLDFMSMITIQFTILFLRENKLFC